MFDIGRFKNSRSKDSRYSRRLSTLKDQGKYTKSIEETVDESVGNLTKTGTSSFVIYGEPQSGKTEMMNALTARLLDDGYRMNVVLLNDSVQLLNQNLLRFRRSSVDTQNRPVVDT